MRRPPCRRIASSLRASRTSYATTLSVRVRGYLDPKGTPALVDLVRPLGAPSTVGAAGGVGLRGCNDCATPYAMFTAPLEWEKS